MLFYVIINFQKNVIVIIIIIIIIISWKFFFSGMFRDFPECSGIFRNVPRSGVLSTPDILGWAGVRTPAWEATLTSRDYIVKPSGSLVSFLQGKLGSSLVSFD